MDDLKTEEWRIIAVYMRRFHRKHQGNQVGIRYRKGKEYVLTYSSPVQD
jgi:hypothetical protein